MSTPESEAALRAAMLYRNRGWNSLPSRHDRKAPALSSFADYWDRELPERVYQTWDADNVQVMTGARWDLVVVDCDGDEAHAVWRAMKGRYSPHEIGPWPTWVARTGGGGWHYWFTLPEGVQSCPSGRLWGVWDTFGGPRHEGDWCKHREIRLLGDKSLVVAPPSIHVETGRPYRWLAGRSPDDYLWPAPAPGWLLDLPRLSAPSLAPRPAPAPAPARPALRPPGAFATREEVLAAIPDKVALAQRWGLRFASLRPTEKGWCAVHAIDRDDRHPSAGFSPETGVYHEKRDETTLSLFDLGVALGHFATWEEAKDALAAEFLPRAHARSRDAHARRG